MLEHRYRFHGHGSVRRLYRHGGSARNRSLTLRYYKNPQRLHSRVTIVVAKKVYKAATKRNRIRRRIYEIIRIHWAEIAPSHDMAIIVFDGQSLVMPATELEKLVLGLLRDAKLWTRTPDNLAK